MKIGLISNMYPSQKFPVFGIFVKNIEILLNSFDVKTIERVVIEKNESLLFKLIAYIKFYLKSANLLLFKKVDLAYIHFPLQISPVIYFCSFFSSKKIVLNIHGSELNPSSIFHFFFEQTLKKVNLIVVPSDYYKNRIIEEYGIDKSKLYVYPSGGINFKLFKELDKQALRKKYKIPTDSFICSYISSIFEEKGWRVFFNASKKILVKNNNINFLVVGNGPQEKEFKALVKQYSLDENYYFFDRQDQLKLVEFYNCSDVFIFPTYRKEESLGLVGLESLACGVPVIGSEIGAIKNYIKNGENGFLFEIKNDNQLMNRIFEYYNSENKKQFIENAILTAENFDSFKCTDLLAKRLKNI